MRILLTGGAGFVGTHVVDKLIEERHVVTIVDNLSSGSPAHVNPNANVIIRDIRAPLNALFRSVKPEVVIHLAAQVSVPESILNPQGDASVNINGLINVVESAAKAGVRKVITMSTAAVYGPPGKLPIREDAPTEPLSPYGASKLAGECYVRLLGKLRGLAYTIIRPGNIYGPRQTTTGEGAVVPALLNRMLSGKDPTIHGDGSQTRDFVYVHDVATALVKALDRGDGMTLNVSSGVGATIQHVWRTLAGYTSWPHEPKYASPREGDIVHSVLDNKLAREHLHWAPQVHLDTGLLHTVNAARLNTAAFSKE